MPSYVLNPIGEDPHAYDDVATDEVPLVEPSKPEKEEGVARKGIAPQPQQQPVRKAPPVPPPPPQHPPGGGGGTQDPVVQTKPLEGCASSASANPLKTTTGLPSDQRSNHSYEEIAASELAASEVASEVIGF